MTDPSGTNTALIEEISALRKRILEMEQLHSRCERMAQEAKLYSKRLAELNETGLLLTSELNLDELLDAIVNRALNLLGGGHCNCFLHNPGLNLLERVAYAGLSLNLGNTTRQYGEGFVGQVWATGGPLLVKDYHSWQGRRREYDPLPPRALMGVPIRWGEEFLGVLNIAAPLPHEFTDADTEVLGLFAMQAAIAIHNARLFQQLTLELAERERTEKELSAIAEIGRGISSTLDIDRVYGRFVSITRELIPFDTLSVNLTDPSKNLFRIVYFSGSDFPGRRAGTEIPLDGTMTEHVVRGRKAVIFTASNTEELARVYPELTKRLSIQAGFHSSMLIPLFSNDAVIGVLHFRAKKENAYTERDLGLAEKIGMQIAGAIANGQLYAGFKKTEQELKESEQRSRELSTIDDLTKLYNSRHFYVQLKSELDRANRYGQPLTLLLLDLDNFKTFNDTYGHVEGNQVLSRFGQVVKRCLRETDFAYRYGGEEFTILLPMTTCADGTVTAERVRTELKTEHFSPAPGQDVQVTVSIGLAQYKPQEEMKAFVHRVDQLMYLGKKNGKDRVCTEPSVQAPFKR